MSQISQKTNPGQTYRCDVCKKWLFQLGMSRMPDVRPDIRPDRTSGSDPDPADFQPDEPDFSGIFFKHFNTFFVQSFRFSSLVSYQKTVSRLNESIS